MFERYTDQARRTLFFARYEAFHGASAFIETEHVLLGLFRDDQSPAGRALARAGVSREAIRQEIESRTARRVRTPVSSADDVPFSEETERALHYADQEAERLLHQHVGPEHLLLGLFREERGLAATILNEHGLHLASVRDEIVQMSSASGLPAGFPFHVLAPTDRVRLLRVSPSRRDRHEGPMVAITPQRVTAEGMTLRELVAWAYRADARRIDLPDGMSGRERYDARLDLPAPQSWPMLDRLIQDGLDRHFGITVTSEVRPSDVFVLTAIDGPSPGRRTHDDQGAVAMYTGFSTVAFSELSRPLSLEGPDWRNRLHSVGPILLTATTMEDFARWLQDVVGHQVIDSTGLTGAYDIDVKEELQGLEELRQALREQLALVLTRDRRETERLAVRRKLH
jgi:uncharacterized protein (TIGR03435 family)